MPEDKDISRTLTEGRPIVISNERSPVARAYSGFAGSYLQEFGGPIVSVEASSNNGHRRGRQFRLLRRKG